MSSKLKTYIVHRKKGPSLEYIAESYTEDKKAARIYFLSKSDKGKKERFVFLSEVSGIDIQSATKPQLSREEVIKQLTESGLTLQKIFAPLEAARQSSANPQ